MFGYFGDPFYDPFEYRPIRIYHPFSAMNRYFDHLEQRLNTLFADAFDEEFHNMIEHEKPKEEKEQKEQKEEKPKEEKEEKPQDGEFKKELKETQHKIYDKIEHFRPKNYYSTYSSQRYFNGNEKFEEIREQTNDGEKTYISKIKRIGNRWCQVDEVVDKDGKKTTKETWHNVGEDEIDAFENEWSLRRGIEAIGSKEEKPAIKAENTEKKEEAKEETKQQ
ncbi:cysteine protease [Histomonas meleagridis]|uniref:cysteine protease n=1 Tax=Histomonas meleagridis TaxID=135588 RepID=UPI00355A0E95|nr:cysteine protease [Histomonas meleagridis]KAH0800416.1 cysteine protease [Histomonas meleagridis]